MLLLLSLLFPFHPVATVNVLPLKRLQRVKGIAAIAHNCATPAAIECPLLLFSAPCPCCKNVICADYRTTEMAYTVSEHLDGKLIKFCWPESALADMGSQIGAANW